MKLIIATKNKHKLLEIKDILKNSSLEIISMDEAGFSDDIEETGTTFEENALIKARAIMEATGFATLADDSGLEIDYLDKQPGIYSARYLGYDTPYTIKNKKIIEMLGDIPDEARTARYVCAIAVAYPDKEAVVVSSTFEGIIARDAAGEGGFGYDPIFYIPSYKMTVAEMSEDLKNRISHRALTLQKIKDVFSKEGQA